MKKKKRLIWQIFPSFLLIILFSLLAVSWYASDSMRHFFLDQTAVDLNVRAVLLEKQISVHLSPIDPPAVDSICKSMGQQSATRYTVILPSGKVIGDSRETPQLMDNHGNRPEIVRALAGETGRAFRYSNTLLQPMMYVARPIRENGNISAVMRAAIPTTFIDRELRSIQLKIAIAGLLIALAAAGASLWISGRITRPIEAIKIGAGHFAGGDFSRRLAAPDSEEMAGLADALNRMAAQLDHRINTIVSQRNELKTVLASMREGVIAVDNAEKVINMNAAAAEFFNCKPADIQNRDLQEITRNTALQQFVRNSISSQTLREDDISLYQNGQKTLHMQSSPLLDANQAQVGTLVVFNEVTHIRRLENMRRDFVANVSHEIKTPLTAIKGFVETLLEGSVDDPAEAERFLGIINKNVDRLNAIVEDLLSLSRIEQEDAGKTIELADGNIKDVFQSAMQICRAKAEEKNIRLIPECDDQIAAKYDATLLEQAVVNLLDNAIKYSEPHRTIHLKARHSHSEILIRVEDQGLGIAQKHLPRLFERFYRVDKARSRTMGGTGLGLAIVKHIAQAHGGDVTVESTLGQGSTFTIHLPLN